MSVDVERVSDKLTAMRILRKVRTDLWDNGMGDLYIDNLLSATIGCLMNDKEYRNRCVDRVRDLIDREEA